MLAVRCAALRGLSLYYKAGDCDDDRNAPRTVGPVTLGFLLRLLPRTFGLNFTGLTTISFLLGGDNNTFVAPDASQMSGTSRKLQMRCLRGYADRPFPTCRKECQ